MAIEQLSIKEIVKRAVDGTLNIPEFQRGFVWDAEKIKLLAESLYKRYPVGTFLIWDSSKYGEAKTAEGTQSSMWLVDGQQRTTALCFLLGQKPYWWPNTDDWNRKLEKYNVMVKIYKSDQEEDDELEFAIANPVRKRDPRWVSIREIFRAKKEEEISDLCQKTLEKLDKLDLRIFSKLNGLFLRIWNIKNSSIPVIKIDHELEDVAEIFARLNQAGVRVKEADVTLALAAVKNPGWIREEYIPFATEIADRGWPLDAGIFIRTMTTIGKGRARIKEVSIDFWAPSNLPDIWQHTKETIVEVIKRLAEYGILSADLLPSMNSLIPLFGLHHIWKESTKYNFNRVLYWFLMANADGRYSGSAITRLNEDAKIIKESQNFEIALDNLLKKLNLPEKFLPEDFLNRYDKAGSRFLRLLLYLLIYHNNAVDWVDKTRIGYDKTGNPLPTGFNPNWHHIYPKSKLKKFEVIDDDINCLANITVMNEETNCRKLQDKEPWDYILKFDIKKEHLITHLIPQDFVTFDKNDIKDKWAVKKFNDFISARAELLAEEANKFINKLKNGEKFS